MENVFFFHARTQEQTDCNLLGLRIYMDNLHGIWYMATCLACSCGMLAACIACYSRDDDQYYDPSLYFITVLTYKNMYVPVIEMFQ